MVNRIKNQKYLYIIPTIVIIVGLLLVYSYYILSKGREIEYRENSNIDYSVCLKENQFYDNKCVSKGNQYVASLIDYIPANFNYRLDFLNSGVEYVYNYSIIAEFNVLDNENDKVLYTKEEVLYVSDDKTSNGGININYNLNIDYNKYNNLLNNFISVYDLNQTKNTLKVSMDVNVKNKDNQNIDFSQVNASKATSITIPLTTKTVNIDISGTTLNTDNDKIVIKPDRSYALILVIGIALLATGVITIILFSYLIKKNKTVREIYEERIKKITLAYDSYIQKITGDYPIGASQICKVSTFRDMIEIKESSEKPLLMLENKEKTGTFFLIPVGEGVIYTYAIRIVDIEAELNGLTPPDYEAQDISTKHNAKKFYTMEKIQEDIKNTTEIEILDDKNAILGTKNSDEDLYEQLGKTSEYNFNKKKKN
jgi:hypothetical protein